MTDQSSSGESGPNVGGRRLSGRSLLMSPKTPKKSCLWVPRAPVTTINKKKNAQPCLIPDMERMLVEYKSTKKYQ